jgi:hypothetical protein
MEHKDLMPGFMLRRTSVCDCKFLVILLSSDIEPGFGPHEGWWRCASFQIHDNHNEVEHEVNLLGAQIVLFTIHELFQMEHIGKINY